MRKMKHGVILCLMAWVGSLGLQAQTIKLPTKKKEVKTETAVPQKEQTPKEQVKKVQAELPQKAQQLPEKTAEAAPVATGGAMTLPTTKRTGVNVPVEAQSTKTDTVKFVMGKPLPVVRRQTAPRAKPIVPKPKVEDNTIYESAEHMPVYPGGAAELMNFIAEHQQYPQEALADSAQGIVQVSFIVEKDGSTTDFEVLDEHHPLLEAEAVRVLQQMPKWNPAKQNGVKVRVEYVVPVKFTLPNQ